MFGGGVALCGDEFGEGFLEFVVDDFFVFDGLELVLDLGRRVRAYGIVEEACR